MMPISDFGLIKPIGLKSSSWRHSREKSPPMFQIRPVLPTFPPTRREKQMSDNVKYYAVVDDLSNREQPAGVFRRTYFESGGRRDEAFTRNLVWEHSASLVSAERGDLQNDFIEITEDEANQLMEQLRARWTGATNT
jgi:hypothetical protein